MYSNFGKERLGLTLPVGECSCPNCKAPVTLSIAKLVNN